MSFPEDEPWSDFPSSAFLDEVLAARARESKLLGATARDDFAFVQAWVDSRWPSKIDSAWIGHLPYPGPAPSRPSPEAIDYAKVVHNRPMDESDTAMRVANLVVALLTLPNVDECAQGEVYLLDGPGWADAVRALEGDPPSPSWLWSVECGNHRILAQHLLGIGPYAVVRLPEYWE